ncbi:CUB and sushi domain-containing protein 3-like [Patiria miniata]|uniref:CUB domain-containing protein n=1 Tax=Patiria miniata TaxID=46514 RepID=A0A913ZMG9_PATMI|nr:CUB and sushi domain-containing protein 3-like [Patiria miniata]
MQTRRRYQEWRIFLLIILANGALCDVPCGKSNITLSNSTQTSETLTSPYYPNNYPNDAQCIWFITVDEGSTIAFRFSVFNTEQTYDTLTMGNGHESSDGDSVIGLWSGFLTSLSVVSNNHAAWMKFTSDSVVTKIGFEVKITQESYEGFCGKSNITLSNSTQTSETLTSPYYPNNYPNNARCIWFITVDEGSKIAFRFSVFNTEQTYDTLTIGNGHESSDGDSVIGLFSSSMTSLAVISNNHTAWMEFTSDSLVTEVGFEVKITQERSEGSCGQDEFACQDESSGLICLARDDTCDGDGFTLCPDGSDESNCLPCGKSNITLSNSTQTSETLTSPYYPNNYPNDAQCIWFITVDEGSTIAFRFSVFNTEQTYDTLTIGNGHESSDGDSVIGLWSGFLTNLSVVSNNHAAWMKFTSDSVVTKIGFEVKITQESYEGFCGKSNITLINSTQTSETLTSPYYPNNYPNNAQCIWFITVDEGSTIAFSFSVFNTEQTHDALTIGNGHESSDGDSVIGLWSGFLTSLSVVSNNHAAWMKFTSDSVVTKIGFEVKITQESYEGFCGKRNITLSNSTQTSETLTSPYYPNNYPNDARCIWFITVDEGSTIAFRFSVFNTERTYDTLTIGNGHKSSDGDSVIGLFSSSLTSLAVISNNHTAWMKFTSDSLVTEVGFEVKITQERSEGSCGQDEFACQDESSGLICLARDDTCDGDGFTLCPDGSDESNCLPCGKSNITLSNSTQTSETLTSPYYPNNYPNDAQCIWFITVDEGSTIAFRFSVFNTEQTYDTLTIGNGHESSDGDSGIGLWSGFLTNLSVVSNNHAAWMKFTSDSVVTKIGFEVKITQESYEGFCGKRNITLSNSTQTSETLTSPYYPNNYPNNARCIWFITVDEGSTIAFRFSVFNTERTYDTLSIGNGHESSDGDSGIGLWSGFLTNLSVVSNNHAAWMKFTSDSVVTKIGFVVKIIQESYEGFCGKRNITLNNSTQTSETLTSPYYPNNYPNNARCIWFITVDEGSRIAFRFSLFNMERTYDTLSIGNGHEYSDGDSVIGLWSGFLTNLSVVSNNHAAWMEFTSDSVVTKIGFEVKITQESYEGFCGKRNITLNNSTQTSETLTSPYYPNNYPNNARCIWFITVDEGSTIAFRFSVFNTERTWDKLTIGNGHESSDGDSGIGLWSGFLTNLSVVSNNHAAWMKFTSDSVVTKIGFEVKITQESYESFCGKRNITLNNSTQTLETLASPYYPNNYPNNARCIWFITVDEGSMIAFRFSVFNTERTHDTLTIGNGHESSDGDSVIGFWSGFLTNLSVVSNNHAAWMKFTSNSMVTKIGFVVKITQESYEGFCGKRNITLSNSTQTSETLTSPYYPNNYPNNARCIWFITVDEGSTIAFRFSVFNTERTWDKLTIGNGHESFDDNSVIGLFSSFLTSLAVISNNHTAWMEFTSDFSVTEIGFEVKITQERPEGSCGQDEFACQDESSGLICLARDDTCDGDGFTLCPDGSDESNCLPCGKSNITLGNSTQTSETLTSPYYPKNYPNDAQCIWFITVDEGSTIAFRFSMFNTERTWDTLTIGNGHESSDGDSVIGLFSGVLTSLAAVSNNHAAWMKFTSNSWVTKIGFKVKITQESYEGYCGKRIITLSNSTQTSETLTSPYYPNNYPNNARCIWFITVDKGSTIAFRFSVFNTELTYDALTIGNGYDSSDVDSVIGLLSSSLPSLAVVSNNHTAWMKFTSDSSVTEIGFEVNITQERSEGYCGKRNITLSNSTQTSETLTSPYYPNNYPNNARCIWFITVDEGSTIAFRFSVFNTEQTHDTLTIGNGHEFSDGYSVIGHFSSSLTNLAVVSNNHTAWMKFTSDYSVTEVGFEVKITQERPEGFCGKRNITLNNSTQTSETLTSPYYPNNYPTNARCIWFITVDEGSTIAFRFSVFKTEHTYDIVSIGNGHAPLDGESIIGRFNGFLTSLAIFSSNHTAWMDFASDGSVTKIGFNVTITQERSEVSCGQDESVCEDASSGLICLTRDDTCDGFLLCPDELDESNCGPCRKDQFQCSVSGLCIDASKHCDGVLSCDDNTDETGCEHCGGISTINVTNGHSFVLQMNYEPDDVNFPLGRHCVWFVTASKGYRVKITFRDYMLSQNSALLFGHGEVQFSNIEAVSRHGTYTKLHIISETNNLWIALVISTSMTSANRVSLEIEELRPVECNDAEFACPSGLACIPRNQVCDGYPQCPMKGDEFGCGSCYEHQFRCPEGGCIGSLYECNAIPGCLDLWDEMNCFPCGEGSTILDSTQTSATLTSVYYPNDYPNNALCIWLITADVGSAIAFRFSGFNTEKTYDMVYHWQRPRALQY